MSSNGKIPAYEYEVWLVRVVDGDTIEVDVDLGFRVTVRQTVRCYGFNTPERGQPGYKEAADALGKHIASIAPYSSFVVRSIKPQDKYGRWIVEIPGAAESLIAAGYAVPYFGGKR